MNAPGSEFRSELVTFEGTRGSIALWVMRSPPKAYRCGADFTYIGVNEGWRSQEACPVPEQAGYGS